MRSEVDALCRWAASPLLVVERLGTFFIVFRAAGTIYLLEPTPAHSTDLDIKSSRQLGQTTPLIESVWGGETHQNVNIVAGRAHIRMSNTEQ